MGIGRKESGTRKRCVSHRGGSATLENLEARRLLAWSASISGTVYNDANGNGHRDGGEAGLAGVRIYVDKNDNRQLDAGERYTITDAAGGYTFHNLHGGYYVVRQFVKEAWRQTQPTGHLGQHLVVGPKGHRGGVDFGQQNAGQWWTNFGGDAQHTAVSSVTAQHLRKIHWHTTIDLAPTYEPGGNELLAHYGSPLVTPNDTVIIPVKTTADGNFRIDARRGSDGKLLWSISTDYKVPPHIEFPEFQPALTTAGRLYFPGPGGTIYYRDHVDEPGYEPVHQIAYYGLDQYKANKSALDAVVFVNTPLTVDKQGNVFYGVQVNALEVPLNLTGGVVRLAAGGGSTFVSARDATQDDFIGDVAQQSAMALSNDGKLLYVGMDRFLPVGVGAGIRAFNYLVALDAATLKTVTATQLIDPASGAALQVSNGGTSSPMVGPDGDVYFGVVESPFNSHHNRGWLLHFNRDLTQSKVTGGFGWDDTPSLVPASMVPSYHGSSSYLLMTKYNRYVDWGDHGLNKIAVLDPNATQKDDVTGLDVMKEVLTIGGPTHEDVPGEPLAVKEWCINTAVVDPKSGSILVGSEDGKLYRWSLRTNTLAETIVLTPGLGEAYTPTVIGSDGTVYAVNNAVLFAVGD